MPEDSAFGYSADSAIPVGGGLLYGKFNEERYLDRLRDADGLPVQFSRRGSVRPIEGPPVDLYEVMTAGGTSLHLFLNMYAPMVDQPPKGFTFAPGPAPDLPRSLAQTFRRRDQLEEPLRVHRRWRIVGEGETIGHVEWFGDHSVAVDLGPNMAAGIQPELDRLVASARLCDLALLLDDYLSRVLPYISGGLVRGVTET